MISSLIIIATLLASSLSLRSVPEYSHCELAHSFNDLDIARQLLKKGVRYFKFDASLSNEQSCSGYSSWKSEACIAAPEYAQEMCCLAMRGDASSAPNFHYPFNTSSQFITLLDDFLSEHHNTIPILFVAIDFQFEFWFGNSLAQRFMTGLAALMQKYSKLHISCKGDYILEYDRICRYPSQQDSTPSEQGDNEVCTSDRRSISNSRFFLQSGSMDPQDPRDYKGRFQNFNTIFTQIDRLCASGFPQWINRNPSFPLIFWQPSNEQQIQASLAKLMSSSCRQKHNRTLSGIALASNVDPEMFEMAMQVTTLQGVQFPWAPHQQKLWLQNATSVHMAKIVAGDQQEKMVLYRKINSYNETRHFLSLLKQNSNQDIILEREVEIHEEVQELRGIKDRVVAVVRKQPSIDGKRQFDAVLMAIDSALRITGLLPVNGFLISTASSDKLFFMTLTSNPMQFQSYLVSASLQSPVPYKMPVHLPQAQMQSIRSVFFKSSDSQDSEDVFLVLGDDSQKTWIARILESQEHQLKTLTFGTNAQIAEHTEGRIVITLENSYDHGGLLMNNNGENTCIYHQVEILKPLSHLRGLVDAIDAPLDHLLLFLEEDSQEVVTGCHPTLPLAKHFNGASVEPLSIWNRLFFSTQMIPLPKQDLICTIFSGSTNYLPQLKGRKGHLLLSILSAPNLSLKSRSNLQEE